MDVFSLILVRASPSLAAICIHALLIIPTLFSSPMECDYDYDTDERLLYRRPIRHGAHRTKMSSAYRRHQGLVRFTFPIQSIITVTHLPYSVYSTIYFFDLFRLEERGWLVSNANLREAGGGGGERGSVVLVKTSKKKGIMDHERYLDATQRYVHPLFTPPSFSSALPFPFPFPFPSSVFVSFFGCVHSYS